MGRRDACMLAIRCPVSGLSALACLGWIPWVDFNLGDRMFVERREKAKHPLSHSVILFVTTPSPRGRTPETTLLVLLGAVALLARHQPESTGGVRALSSSVVHISLSAVLIRGTVDMQEVRT